jgi:ABC-type dipeptide/oligopeptide/nickel transport system ATPase subunit
MKKHNLYTLGKLKKEKGGYTINSIIKEKAVQFSNPVSIGGEKEKQTENDHKAVRENEIETIIENGEVVGIIHHCQCGKSTEIRFDY